MVVMLFCTCAANMMPLLSFVAACVQRYKTTLSLQCNGSELSNSSAVASRSLGCRRDSYLSADPIPHERLPPVSATLWCQAFILAGGASAVPPLHLRVFVPQKLRRLLTIVTHSCTALQDADPDLDLMASCASRCVHQLK